MDVTSSFVSRSVTSTANLNWVFLVDWLIVFFAAIVFIFYFNRLLGYAVTWLVTHIFWRRRKNKLSIHAIKINLLGGRIFLKNVMIVTPNEMVMMHTVVLTWKYWLRSVRKSRFYVQEERLSDTTNRKLPLRLSCDIVGMEVFLYNRSAAYDEIEKVLKGEARGKRAKAASSHRTSSVSDYLETDSTGATLKNRRRSSYVSSSSSVPTTRRKETNASSKTIDDLLDDGNIEKTYNNNNDELFEDDTQPHEVMDSTFLDFLPLEINVTKGALVLGNETTPQLYVASYSSMTGIIDATLPGSPLDYYRTHYDFTLNDFILDLKTNVSFKDMETLERKMREIQNRKHGRSFISTISGLGHSVRVLHEKFNQKPSFHTHSEDSNDDLFTNESKADAEEWHGLERYLTTPSSNYSDITNIFQFENQISDLEYAKCSNIVQSEVCKINYYYDSQGLVPKYNPFTEYIESPDLGNMDIPPMFGLDITVYGTSITYGPWAEKQRGDLHQVLFPPLYRDSLPFKKLRTGMRRQYASFDLSVECGDELVLRIPHREESKDIQYLKGSVPKTRPYGWLDLKLGRGSIIDVSVAMLSTLEKGTDNKVNAVFLNPVVSTSVNHDILFEADEHVLNASTAFPLKWNSLANWTFENISKNANLYLLREHITLISDLLGDFASGTPTPYELFRPFIYNFNWKLYDYAIFLNINEQNIINNPLDHSINTFMTIRGSYLLLNITIPLTAAFKKSNKIEYVLETNSFDISVEHPTSSTFSNFMQDEQIGNANNFKMDGSYTMYSFVEIDSTDTIIMNCICQDTTLKVYGFAIKYFLSLKENYFGDNTHFQNLLEFRESFGKQKEEVAWEGKRLKNETDLMFSFRVNNGCLVFPCHLYDCTSHLALHFDALDIDVRNNNYYMDLQANFSDIEGRYVPVCDEKTIFENTKSRVSFSPEIVVDELSIHSIRIFGLPPSEPTYYCRWTFNSTKIEINAEPLFLSALSMAGKSFKSGHSDLENSLSLPEVSVMDILNLSFKCDLIKICIKREDYSVDVSLGDIFLKLSDQPTTVYNSILLLFIKTILIEGFDKGSQILKIATSLEMKNFMQKKDAFERMKQQAFHVKKHDAPFHRVPFLIPEFAKDRKYFKSLGTLATSLNYFDPPLPLTSQAVDWLIDSFPLHIQQRLARIAATFDDNHTVYDDPDECSSNLEDFEILRSLDTACAYNNSPIRLGEIEAFISPNLAPVIVDIITNMTDFNMYSVLDDLQTQFIMFFMFKQEDEVSRLKIECPIIHVKICESIMSNDYLFLGITDLILAFSRLDTSHSKSFNMYTIIKEINLDIKKETKDVFSAAFFNVLFKQSTDNRNILTFDVENLMLFMDPMQISWVLMWALQYKDMLVTSAERWEELQKNKRLARIELLYDLSRGGIEYNISHDPPCITKPSYISAFCNNHIRMDGNWMIIPRLRHVLRNLPSEWLETKNSQFRERSWEAPKNSEEEVSMIFGNWRCWDNHKTKDNFIFKRVFDAEGKIKEKLLQTVKLTLKSITVTISPLTECIVATDIFFFLNEDNLDKAVKQVAMPLLDQPIKKSMDITFRLGSFVTNFTKLAQMLPQLVHSVDHIKEQFDMLKGDQTPQTVDDLGSNDSLNEVERYAVTDPKLITVNFTLDEFSHSIGIDSSTFKLYGHGTSLTVSMIKAEELLSCTLNYTNNFSSAELHVDNIALFEATYEGNAITFINTGSFKVGKSALFFNYDTINISSSPNIDELLHALDRITLYDAPVIAKLSNQSKKMVDEEISNVPHSTKDTGTSFLDQLTTNLFKKISVQVSVLFSVKKIHLHAEFLSPFYINFEMFEPVVMMKVNDSGFLIEYQTNSRLFVGSQDQNRIFQYCTASIYSLKTLITSRYKKDFYDLLINIIIGSIRLNLTQNNMITIISKMQSDMSLLNRNIDLLKERLNCLTNACIVFPSSDIPAVGARSDTMEKINQLIHFFLKINVNSADASVNINGNKFRLDCLTPSVNLKTFDDRVKRSSFHGDIHFPSITISLGLNGTHGFSTIFDMQGFVKIENPKSAEHMLKNLNLTSEFCRVFLTPHVLDELIDIYGDIALLIDRSVTGPVETTENGFEETIDTILSFFSINITAKNLCFGWLFEEENNISNIPPGLIYGFEKTSIICANGAGKIRTDGMYLSTAHGFKPNTFYSTHSEKKSNNRVYFPKFNLVYTFEKGTNVTAVKSQVEGETVDFKFQTDIFSVMEPLWFSISMLQDKFSRVMNAIQLQRSDSNHNVITGKPMRKDSVAAINTDSITKPKSIKVLDCTFKFEGASFYIFNSDIEIDGSIPILSLQSPGLSAALRYTQDIHATKKHSVFLSALISETNNKLSCQCVPVLRDIAKRIKTSMKRTSKNRVVNPKTEPSAPIDFVSLSEKIDVSFSLKIEPQFLALSCEPRANIEAIVAIDVVQVILKTEQDFLSAVLSVKNIKAELKHAYSKVTSGSVSANKLTITSTMSKVNNEKKFVAIAHLQEADAFINIQQRQDLDLFKDFWLPGEFNDISSAKKNNGVLGTKTFSSMLREVSTTTAFPWILSLLLTKFSARVDLGSSLGEVIIDMQNFTALSQKSINWDHSLRFEFEAINFQSKGRLSGMLLLKKIRVTTAISWKRKAETLEIPLVLLACGFNSLESKISLDYHPFFIVELTKLGVTVYNQRQNDSHDKLKSNVNIGSLKVFMTALTASNFVDVYTIGLRIRQDIKLSYRQVLNDAKPHIDLQESDGNVLVASGLADIDVMDPVFKTSQSLNDSAGDVNMGTPSQAFLQMIERLKTYLDFNIGSMEVQVFPSSLLDPQAMVIKVGRQNAMFYQNSVEKIENKVFLDLADITVSLSSFKRKLTSEALNDPSGINSYIQLTSTAIADNIFVFPTVKIEMFTQQEPNKNVVNYKYYCKFGGRVDIKWKIGSAYFIRQMWYSHATTLSNRLTALKFYTSDEYSEETEENYKQSTLESVNLSDRLKDVESDKNYVYFSLEEPDIETPQIKDLGNATPPLEWFGLHRDKFPNLTHQFVIIGLQEIIKQVEQNYSRVLK